MLQNHKGDTADIFEYLRDIDLKTPKSRTNERTKNYLKGQAEDSDWDEEDHNRDEKGRFAKKQGINILAEEDNVAEDKEINNELKLLEYIEKQTFAEDYDPNQPRDIGGKWTKGIQYYSKLPKELREKIKNSSKEVREAIAFAFLGKPVKQLTVQEFQKDNVKLTEKVPAYYQQKYGGKVVNKELGEISLDIEGIKDDIAHGVGSLKASAFMAIPEVVMHGKIFDRQTNWKNRGYDTFVILAPVKIGNKKIYRRSNYKKE